jgi:hypothetical protein
MRLPKPVTLVSVDLGQQRDYTAISVTERVYVPTGEPYHPDENEWPRQKLSTEYRVRHLERPALGTKYTKIVERITELISKVGGEPVLVVDATGVGRPVVDMLWRDISESLERTDIRVTPGNITITGGDSASRGADGGLRVPKRDLVGAPLVLLQNGQLKIAEGLALRDTLVKELLNFRVKINISTAHDSYEAWREGDHDDLVLSVAMACWAGERFIRKMDTVELRGRVLT